MATEYWATFSIYDHRSPNYRRALVVFDKIVIPIATRPFGKLSGKELDQLSAEVDFLVSYGVASLLTTRTSGSLIYSKWV